MCAVKQFCQAMATDLVFVLDELNFDNTSDVYSLKNKIFLEWHNKQCL